MLETVNSDTAGSAQDAPTCEPGSREFLAGAANHSARLLQGTATQSAGEPLQGTTHPQARAAESGPSDGEALARVAQPVEECLVTSGNPESGREVESAEQKEITPDQACGDVQSAPHARPVKSPISAQPSSSQGTAEASVVDAGKTEEAEYSIKHGSRSESLGSEEPLQRVRGSGSDILGLDVLLLCSSVQRLRGSGGDRSRRGGTSLNQGLDVTSHRRAAGRGRGSSAGRGMRSGHSSDLRGRGDLRQRRSVGGGFVRSAALDEAPSAASPGDHAGASAKASYLRDARSPMAQWPHPQSRPSGDRGMNLRGSISLAKPQIQSSGSPNDGIGAPSCQLPRSPGIAARTRTPETPPWNNRGAADTPPPEVQASRGMLPRRGLLSRLSRSPSPAPQAMYPSNCAARRPTHRRRAGLDHSISSTPTPDADHAGASPEDDPDDLWHMRSRTGTQVHASKGQSGAPSLVVQHVRAELAQVSGLDTVMAEQLEQQLVRGLEGIEGVDIAESARILVQRVASAVLQATRGVGDPTLSREYSGNLMDDAAAKQLRNIDSRAGARGHSLGAAAQKAVHDDRRGRGHERGKIRDAREGFGSRGATLPADPQSPGNPSKRLSECYMGGGPGRSGSTGLQEPRGCEGGVGTERSGVKRQSRNIVGEGLQHGVSSTIERVLAAPVEEQGECNGSNKRQERSGSAELDFGPRKQPKRTRPTRDELQQEQRRRESARRCEALGITAVSDDEDFRMPMDVTDTLEEEMGVDVHSPVGNRGGFVRPIEGHLSRKDRTEEEELLLMQASKRSARLRQDPGQVGMGDLLVKTLEERLGRKILDDMPAVMDFSAAIQVRLDNVCTLCRAYFYPAVMPNCARLPCSA
jgi:hypothetical protein